MSWMSFIKTFFKAKNNAFTVITNFKLKNIGILNAGRIYQ